MRPFKALASLARSDWFHGVLAGFAIGAAAVMVPSASALPL